ncbi:DNA polymerase III subunit epsilon [Nitrosococcus watsonii]|uniref:DNA polymerase III subunit epsilon n=1 Tax=Nitrosococcus watsoni (strain C-113) TaxID=105559 RepID=D8K9F5_NITWC|nr:DNA polymerase III subunit epsilon [Nitrosococcus watsonii]ADJ27244.1 DNA polymerase III, epsilon subunit [Nitrosococcus watsonii C-113]
MRQIILDTETTGLEPKEGHRIIEIGGVELNCRRRTGQTFHCYLNPEREVDEGALKVHGLSNEFLSDKPRFIEIAEEFLAFIKGAELVIHNAPFDVGFLDHELYLLGSNWGKVSVNCQVLDTLQLARQRHPGQKNNLDALCKRYGIDNSRRDLHGALLDAEILAGVYLAMTGGQVSLSLHEYGDNSTSSRSGEGNYRPVSAERAPLKIARASREEQRAHEACLTAIDKTSAGACVWHQLDSLPD